MKVKFRWPFNIFFSPISWRKVNVSHFFTLKGITEKRNIVAGGFLIIGVILIIRAYFVAYQMESGKEAADFNKDASAFANLIKNKLLYSNEVMSVLQTYFNVVGVPSSEVFKEFTEYYLKKNKYIKALAWVPRVSESQRETFLKEAHKIFPSFQILDLQEDGKLVPSPYQHEYYPIYYVEPYQEQANVLGFNLLSNKERRKGIEESRDSGKQIATDPIELLLANDKGSIGFLMMTPIYKSKQALKTLEEKRKQIQGIVIGVFKIKTLLEDLPSQQKKKFYIVLLNSGSPQKNQIFYSTEYKGKGFTPQKKFLYEASINIGSETWSLRLTPKSGHYVPTIKPVDWFFLIFAFLFFILTSIYIWFMLKYYEENSKLVTEFTNLLESTPYPKFIVDKNQRIILINHMAEDLFGYTRSQLVGRPCKMLFTQKTYKKIEELRGKLVKINGEGLGKSTKIESMVIKQNGTKIPVAIELDPLTKTSQETLFVFSFTDLKKIKDLEKNLMRTIFFDSLTKLPNKNYFGERLKKEIAKLLHIHHSVFIFIINLDQFKFINESFGLTIGDIILKHVALRIKRSIRSKDIIARMNGDEFALLTTEPQNKEDAQVIAQRLLNLFELPFQFGNKEIKLSVSIGIAFSSHPKTDPTILINKAELAMYKAKHKGGDTYLFYKTGMETVHRRKFELETALNSALQKDEFFLEYQPIYTASRQKIVGLEALLRWSYPPLGLIPPSEFIPLIENKPLIKSIGKWVFKTACRDYKRWGSQFKGYLSINLAMNQLEDNVYLKDLLDFCEKENISPKNIVLEITESTFIQPTPKSKRLMKIISLKGFPLAVDDFGTKYASLGRLVSFAPTYLKIDKSFIDGIGIKKTEEEIIISILALAKKLDLKTIAEGVETKEQLDFLVLHKCPYIQGFYFSKPRSFEDIVKLLYKQELKS